MKRHSDGQQVLSSERGGIELIFGKKFSRLKANGIYTLMKRFCRKAGRN